MSDPCRCGRPTAQHRPRGHATCVKCGYASRYCNCSKIKKGVAK